MSKKIVFFDIDGTIFNQETREITDKTKLAIKKLKENGHLAYVASGRPKCLLTNNQDIMELGFDGAIMNCGAYIEDFNQDKIVYRNPLSDEILKKIIEVVKESRVDCHFESPLKLFYSPFVDPKSEEQFRLFLEMLGGQMYPIATRVDEPIYKISVTLNKHSDKQLFIHRLKDDLHIMDMGQGHTGYGYIECVDKNCSKGTGMIEIAKYHDIDMKHTFAIGDSTNDLDMIRTAEIGIAMGNASQNVKDATPHHTKSVDEDGVYHALLDFNLIHE